MEVDATMKALRQNLLGSLSSGLLTTLLTLGLFATVGHAQGDGPAGIDTSFGGGSSGGIGTVPDLGEGNQGGLPQPTASGLAGGLVPGPAGSVAPLKPALRLVGTKADLDAVLAGLYSPDGTGWFRIQSSPSQTSIEFYGNTVVDLDRLAFARGGVSVQLSVAPNFAGGVAVLTTPQGRRAVQGLSTGNLDLRLQRTVQSGLAEAGLVLHAKSQQGSRASLSISGSPGSPGAIRLQQRH